MSVGSKPAQLDSERQRAWQAAASVVDPEIPAVTIADLGILRGLEIGEDGRAIVQLTPTYSGCPAVLAIEMSVRAALEEAGFFSPKIERVLSPAWSSDWITDEGRKKLHEFGIAPPQMSVGTTRALFTAAEIACPRCGADNTERVSEFGSTACKALYRCQSCGEPFDYFKCI